ncbi:conjugal transfer protein TraG [Mesorhizobium sp. Root157]|uniref:type IV secretory system conjugative DNA transfer family protein n=1 Tax=Mesorhizobium sp. Root157 TaxID=1736477 RepID=UPI0006FC03FB|nr:type IV secretory system conjugative DNA transfer family protein [Mesorhizobium sp. Root157]KQZ95889.1 conjugal transfer protein TraG [Mesorhizobium sp. Root157]
MTGPLRVCYLIFSLVIGCVIWTLAYGFTLQIFYRDDRVLRATVTTNPLAPFGQLIAYFDSPVLQAVAVSAMVPALFGAGIVAYAGLRSQPAPLGDARFQNAMVLRRGKWFRKKGHILGRFGHRILRVNDDRHHLVIGPTRSGKGVGYVIPNALMHEGSMIVTDLKGEIFRSTAGYRKSRGNQVFLFAPGSARTHRYNPLDFIRPDRGDRTTDIQNIAGLLVPENTESENAIWQATAQQVMAGVISYIQESVFYEGKRNLVEVTSFFSSGVNLQLLMTTIKKQEPYLSRFTTESFNAYIALSERTAMSALLDVQKALRPFRNERIAAASSVTDMDLRAMRHRPISIYLAPNITDISLLRPLLALFVQQALDTMMLEHAAHPLPVYFLLDEFRQLKKMSEITTKLPYVAGYGIKMAFVIQDLKTLDEIYGETARHSLMGNCAYQLVFGANDQVTAESVSKGLGKRTVRYTTESRTIELMGLHRRTKVEQLRERDLMMPQEVRQMPSGKMIILPEGQGPIFADKLRFFATAQFGQLEAFSRANVPDIPALELLPPGAVPAMAVKNLPNRVTSVSASDLRLRGGMPGGSVADNNRSASVAPERIPSSLSTQGAPSRSTDEARKGGASPALDSMSDFFSGNDAEARSTGTIEARFESATCKLRDLVQKSMQSGGPGPTTRNWSRILDSAVPDDVDGPNPK